MEPRLFLGEELTGMIEIDIESQPPSRSHIVANLVSNTILHGRFRGISGYWVHSITHDNHKLILIKSLGQENPSPNSSEYPWSIFEGIRDGELFECYNVHKASVLTIK